MALQWKPEPLSDMQGRYARAVSEIYDARMARGEQLRPGNQRRHVFDFADGLRLIVSRDRLEEGRVGIHVSGSVMPQTNLHELLTSDTTNILDHVRNIVVDHWRLLSGSNQTPDSWSWSRGKGVPHFIIWDVSGPDGTDESKLP